MSLFGIFASCGICCSGEEKREQQQSLSNSQNSNPDRVRQLILESQRQNNLTNIGSFANNQNTAQNIEDPDGFIEITPIFNGPKSGSGSGSELEEDYCEIIQEINSNSRQPQSSYRDSQKETSQVYQEFVSLPIKKSKRRNDQLHGASGSGNNDLSYKASMRSRNSSSNSQDSGSQSRLEKQTKRSTKAWTEEEDRLLRFYYSKHNGKWPAIANEMADRNASQCSQRWRRIKPSKIRRPWTPEEDNIVLGLIKQHGKNWGLISSQMDNRSGKQVRERYINKLDPELNNGQFNEEEDRIIIDKYYKIGPKWSEIAKFLQGRSENMVKNRFYSYIKKTYAINSLQGSNGVRSDNGQLYDMNTSPRLNNENDRASSYASSLYNDLDPSINSGNIESEESSSEGEQYNQFQLGVNNQGLGLVEDKKAINSFNNNMNKFQDDIYKQQDPMYFQSQQQNNQFFQNMPIQQQNNIFIQNPQQNSQQQNQQQFYMLNQENQQSGMNQYQNQNKHNLPQAMISSQDYIKRNNQYKKIENEKVEEMFHTPRLALANNSSFFPSDIFIQQQKFQQEEIMNSNGQQALGNNFFNTSPSPLILLSPAQMKTEQFSFTSNTPGRRFLVSNSNTPYTNNPNSISSQQNNVHFNFNNIASTPNYQLGNQQSQTQYQNSNYNQNYIQNQTNQQYQQQMPSQNQIIDSTGFNQQIFSFQNHTNQANNPNQVKEKIEETFDNLNINTNNNNSNANNNYYNNNFGQSSQQNPHGNYYLPNIPQGQNFNEHTQPMYFQQGGDQQIAQQQFQQNQQYQQHTLHRNQSNREELRLDISCTDNRSKLEDTQQNNNNLIPLATPKIDRKQLKNMIVDLESQLQLLKVQQQFLNDEDSN
ncbi:hypothetical protein ABPG72_012476 [Tetrahymena utriculariae]